MLSCGMPHSTRRQNGGFHCREHNVASAAFSPSFRREKARFGRLCRYRHKYAVAVEAAVKAVRPGVASRHFLTSRNVIRPSCVLRSCTFLMVCF